MPRKDKRRPRETAEPRLFPERELSLRRTGSARLREVAGQARESWTTRERRREEDRRTMTQLKQWGVELSRLFRLPPSTIEAEHDGVVEHYGVCYEDGLIRIRLRHATTGRLLKESSLVDTLCHELAHLRHLNHGVKFQRLYRKILTSARELGYYRPGPAELPRLRQGALFGSACGAVKGELT